ncbi:MAG: acyl-CoA dehydrogenase family protein, partial [Planctomycetes bacterium]|nr:acyl-CoA dehydrogenase family protein [Planctomycetota bacterium]
MARSRKEAFRVMYYLDEDQEILRETIAEYVNEKLIPRREELDKEKRFPHWFYRDMVEMGVPAMIIPEEYEGLGSGLFDVALMIEEIGRGCSGAATSLGATILGIDPLLYFGTDEQKRRFLP